MLETLGSIKYAIRINFTGYILHFFNMATRKLKIIGVAHICGSNFYWTVLI